MDPTHIKFMERCLALTEQAKRNGRTGVGAILVRNGEVVSEGVEGDNQLPSLLAHAEVVAIVKAVTLLATRDLSDCSLYTTVEPCIMCSYIIRSTKVAEVIYGVDAGTAGGATSNYKVLTARDIARWGNPPLVVSGVMEDECRGAM